MSFPVEPEVVGPEVHNVPSTRIFGREPAVILGFIAAGLQLAAAYFLPWDANQITVVNAALSALMGLGIAIYTKDSLLAVGLGAVQALLAVALNFGFNITPEQQSALIAFTNVGLALFNRQQTTPDPQPSLDLNGTSAVVNVQP